MRITIPEHIDIHKQAAEAGFASADEYIAQLLEQDSERRAIQEGIDSFERGNYRPIKEFEAELRKELGVPKK